MSNALASNRSYPPTWLRYGGNRSYRVGPMLIVFGMLFLGTLVVAIREAWLIIHDNHR